MHARILALLCGVAVCLSSATASAQTVEENDGARWRDEWPKVSLAEHIVGVSTFALAAGVWLLVGNADEPLWSSAAPGDTPFRDLLRARTDDGRRAAVVLSDVLWHSTWLHLLAFDGLITAWGIHGDSELASQLVFIDGLAIAGTTLVTMLSQGLFLRERPYGAMCEDDPEYDMNCEGRERYRSFISGHSSVAATAAALTCVHHANIPLYGSPAADALGCAGSITFAVLSGVLRVVADQHFMSDVLAGWVVGALFGIGVPVLLHYGG